MTAIYIYVQIYMNKKTQYLLKLQIFLFFSEALSVYEKASEKKKNICNWNKLFFYSYIYIYTAYI